LSGVITLFAQKKFGAIRGFDEVPFELRIKNALIVYVKYIVKTLWPHDLAVMYPFPSSFPLWQVIGSMLVLILVSMAAIWFGRRYPYLPVGWFWYFVTLLPVIGLIQVGNQSMADRYTYIPMIGLLIIAAWGVSDLTKGLQHRLGILAMLAGVVIIASAILTWQQLGYWQNNISLYQHTLQITSGSYLIHYNLGLAFAENGQTDAAIHEYQMALKFKPNNADAHHDLGIALVSKGDIDAAIFEYKMALRIKPNFTNAHINLGVALAKKGQMDMAIQEFQEALRIDPNNVTAHYNLERALAK
jgi:tetratricopeptide (TPR) repeat protein